MIKTHCMKHPKNNSKKDTQGESERRHKSNDLSPISSDKLKETDTHNEETDTQNEIRVLLRVSPCFSYTMHSVWSQPFSMTTDLSMPAIQRWVDSKVSPHIYFSTGYVLSPAPVIYICHPPALPTLSLTNTSQCPSWYWRILKEDTRNMQGSCLASLRASQRSSRLVITCVFSLLFTGYTASQLR